MHFKNHVQILFRTLPILIYFGSPLRFYSPIIHQKYKLAVSCILSLQIPYFEAGFSQAVKGGLWLEGALSLHVGSF